MSSPTRLTERGCRENVLLLPPPASPPEDTHCQEVRGSQEDERAAADQLRQDGDEEGQEQVGVVDDVQLQQSCLTALLLETRLPTLRDPRKLTGVRGTSTRHVVKAGGGRLMLEATNLSNEREGTHKE